MRQFLHSQMTFGETDIASIKFDLRSRDEIPKMLMGMQYIYCTPELRKEVFAILRDVIPKETDTKQGRPGMELWKILVLGTLRLICNWDYDKLKEIADNHRTLRQMLGHGFLDDEKSYPIQTLKDNISLLTPEVLDRINQVVVKSGHKLLGKKKELELNARCDSFVVETDVHYPTDINLLYDAIEKVIILTARACSLSRINGWRQSKYWVKTVKRFYNKVRKLKHSTSKIPEKKVKREKKIKDAHREYISIVELLLDRAYSDLKLLMEKSIVRKKVIEEIDYFLSCARILIDQIHRRVLLGEVIPHAEKMFSIFEPHTEWISKGKAGVPQELGLKTCVVEDQYGFILHGRVMRQEQDVDVAVIMAKAVKEKFPNLFSLSYDKGFYSPSNRDELNEILDQVILPKKGKLSAKDRELEHSETFRAARHQHSAVESAINCLENHGLDRCPDHGIEGFERYVFLAIIAKNIHTLGGILLRRQKKRLSRKAA